MAGTLVPSGRSTKGRTKVKTGCVTCRIRKVKCDEKKPSCQKCTSTGRNCDGYESPFRLHVHNNQLTKNANNVYAPGIKLRVGLQTMRCTPNALSPEGINLLCRYFSTKTIFNVPLDCNEEAKQVLQASLTDTPIRHAVMSLKALREELESSGDRNPASVGRRTPSCDYGLQQYSVALAGLASKLSSSSSSELKTALLCCQVFISIEQVRGNFAAMALHIVRGLGIMREFRARPSFTITNELLPAYRSQLPFLDVFIVKLFAAPCKFAEAAEAADGKVMVPVGCSTLECRDHRRIAPNMRTKLVHIATSTLDFLAKVSQIESIGAALRLVPEKASLLDSLDSWLRDLELVQMNTSDPESISVSFLRFFYSILRIVLLGALESLSPDLYAKLQTENGGLQEVADDITEKVRLYKLTAG
ncbi:unnamed protein product [Clonostachys rhizophaga]|uniref:Zn(2)-C6 fungal-type domain-containing protein n=1 Tax=Clonostachys rhizophaga TaxID=160324 RepID=A0A9N9VFS7_9HYPO|nr:unnamed protein product [Clonostachys rhizophaga]